MWVLDHDVKLISHWGSVTEVGKYDSGECLADYSYKHGTALGQHTRILTMSHYTRAIIFHSAFKCPIIFITISEIFYKSFFFFILCYQVILKGNYFFAVFVLTSYFWSLRHLFRGTEIPLEQLHRWGSPTFPGQLARRFPGRELCPFTWARSTEGVNPLGVQ